MSVREANLAEEDVVAAQASMRPRRAQRAGGRLDSVQKIGTIGSMASFDVAAADSDLLQ